MDRTQLLLTVSIALFALGLTGVMIRRNALVMLMCMELMLNGVILSLGWVFRSAAANVDRSRALAVESYAKAAAAEAIEQERIDFEQNVYLQVQNFMMQQRQLAIAAKADTVARKGFDIAKQRYLIGKIDIINLRDAQSSNDNATISFIRSLQDYWINYYQLRKLTLFDFRANQEISIDFEKLR